MAAAMVVEVTNVLAGMQHLPAKQMRSITQHREAAVAEAAVAGAEVESEEGRSSK
jgi:hypothetical protein